MINIYGDLRNKMSIENHRKWKLKMYGHWRDTLEQRLAGVNAAMAKLEEQMNRDVEEKFYTNEN
mgnify:FL=1